ncbi:hypothetical protein [Ralstonia sp. NFACC01]|uniref:hypothetical protein n=1 Tax=Ralstonia sp. NFACC01 TaxID=1566294 RepID=UPI001113E727|nr:hypothetical protein [Ralstonia sp. NFACC01]
MFSRTWCLAYSILGEMMKARGKFAVLVPVLVLLHGCAVLAPADDVTGTIQLERYSVAALDGLAIDGKTTLNDLTTKLGPGKSVAQPHDCSTGLAGSTGKRDDKRQCQIYVWAFNRINYGDRRLTNRSLSISVVTTTGIVDRHQGGGYDKPY